MLFCVLHRVLFWEIWWKCVRGLGKLIFFTGFGVASYARFCNKQCCKFYEAAILCSQSLLLVVDYMPVMSDISSDIMRKTLNLKWNVLVKNCFSDVSIYCAYKLPNIWEKILRLETRDDHIPFNCTVTKLLLSVNIQKYTWTVSYVSWVKILHFMMYSFFMIGVFVKTLIFNRALTHLFAQDDIGAYYKKIILLLNRLIYSVIWFLIIGLPDSGDQTFRCMYLVPNVCRLKDKIEVWVQQPAHHLTRSPAAWTSEHIRTCS